MVNSSLSGPALARGPSQEVIEAWNYIAEKLVEMAENFPEDKYGYRPTPEVRSFAEHLLHVAEANYILISAAQGTDRKSTRLNSSHIQKSRMPSSA